MGGSSKTTETSFKSQPGVNEVLGTAKTIFDSGVPWAPDTSSHVTPFSMQTMAGLKGMENAARGAVPAFGGNLARIGSTVNQGGLDALQTEQIGRLRQTAQGNGLGSLQQSVYNRLNPTATGLNDLQMTNYKAMAPTANGLNATQQQALDLLRRDATANPAQNPYLNEVIRRSSEDIGNSTNLTASAAGRYGSGAHAGVLADAVGDMSAELRYGDYNNQQARRDAALRDFGNLATTGYGQRMGALTDRANLATTGMGQRMNALTAQGGLATTGQNQRADAIGSLYNAGQQRFQNVLAGTDALQNAYDARLDPYRTLLDAGQQYEGLQGRVLQDQARILQERKNALTDPVNWLANLAGAFQGGQQVQTTRTTESPFSNPLFSSLLGKAFNL